MFGRKVGAVPVSVAMRSALLPLLLGMTAFAWAQNPKKTNTPPPQGTASGKPASGTPHQAPAQHPHGTPSAGQRPATPGGASTNKGAPANANRGGQTSTNKGAPANANKGGQTNPNNGAPTNGNRGGQTSTNKGAPTNANKGGQTNANKGAPANANRGGQTSANKGAPANANKVNQSNSNKGAPTNGNRGGQTSANKGAPASANRGGQTSTNKGSPANANRAGTTSVNNSRNNAVIRHQPAGSKTVVLKSGGSATYRSNGQVRVIQTQGMTINRGMYGNTRIVSTHNGRTVVSYGRGVGYSQRSYYSHGGHVYVQRTYYRGGHYYAYGYRTYHWGGRSYYGYAPAYYWHPAYYRWAYNPWPAPVYYSWGWSPAPWYGYYGPYFAPYPVYPTAAFWLTDYLIAANLQAAYMAQQAAAQSSQAGPQPLATASARAIASFWPTNSMTEVILKVAIGAYMLAAEAPPPDAGATQLSPEVKQAIADQMKQEIAKEQAAAASGKKDTPSTDQMPAALDPKIRIFVVSSDLDLTTSERAECGLTPGDVVYRTGDKPDADNMVHAIVKSSKKDECAVGATVAVDAGDLQEMHNQLRIQLDAGLKELAEKQGKDGIPTAPDTKTQAGEIPAPKPDESVASDLQQQLKDAAQVQAQLPNSTGNPN